MIRASWAGAMEGQDAGAVYRRDLPRQPVDPPGPGRRVARPYDPPWRESCEAYRAVVRDNPDFVAYFRYATPEQELANCRWVRARPGRWRRHRACAIPGYCLVAESAGAAGVAGGDSAACGPERGQGRATAGRWRRSGHFRHPPGDAGEMVFCQVPMPDILITMSAWCRRGAAPDWRGTARATGGRHRHRAKNRCQRSAVGEPSPGFANPAPAQYLYIPNR